MLTSVISFLSSLPSIAISTLTFLPNFCCSPFLSGAALNNVSYSQHSISHTNPQSLALDLRMSHLIFYFLCSGLLLSMLTFPLSELSTS